MSFWTSMVFEIATKEKLLTRFVGKEMTWEDMNDSTEDEIEYAFEHPEVYLPMGSEGTASYDKRCERKYYLYGLSVPAPRGGVWWTEASGSLRDYDSADSILTWFKKKLVELSERGYHVVLAQIMADDSGGKQAYVYDPEGIIPQHERYDGIIYKKVTFRDTSE